MPPIVNDAVNVNGFADQFIHNAVGIHADLPHCIFADFRYHPAEARCLQKNVHFFGNVLHHAGAVAFGIVGNVLVNQAQILAGWC